MRQSQCFRRCLQGTAYIWLALAIALPCSLVQADNIRKIVHPDGHVEYTNVPKNKNKRYSGGKKSEVIYRYRQGGVLSFTDTRPLHIRDYEILRFDCFACGVRSSIDWHTTPLYPHKFADLISQAAAEYKVDPALIRAIIHAESGFRPNAKSSKGAQGLMQLMPQTAEELGVSDSLNPKQNIFGGTRYLSALMKRYHNNVKLTAAAYNAGPGAVKRYAGIPPYAETKAYVRRVSILRARYANPG